VQVLIISRPTYGVKRFPIPGHTHRQTSHYVFLTTSHRRRDHGACSSTSVAWCRGWMRTDIEALTNALASYRLGSSPCGGRSDWKNQTWPAVAFTRQTGCPFTSGCVIENSRPLARHKFASRQPNQNSEGAQLGVNQSAYLSVVLGTVFLKRCLTSSFVKDPSPGVNSRVSLWANEHTPAH
jgi:hypothetical protein